MQRTTFVVAATLVAATMLVIAGAPPAAAQTPDFSGSWRLDRDASDIPEPTGGLRGGRGGGAGRGGGRRGGPGGPGGFAGPAETLVITQTSDLLTVEQPTPRGGTRPVTYRLDGGESTSRGPRGDLVTTSSWDGATLLTVGTLEVSTPRGDFALDIVEQRSVSADGRTLTVQSVRMLPFGEVASTLVYRKEVP